ncbi:unnamed protein product, partial [Ixodes pacificus]
PGPPFLGANPNPMMSVEPALMAAYQGDLLALCWLQQHHADCLRVCDSVGGSCVHYAARGGHVKALRFLVQAVGLRPHARDVAGASPAHEAAAAGKTRALRWLLVHTACKVRDVDREGATVLHIAAR